VNKIDAIFPDTGFDAVQKFDQQPVILRVRPESAAERAGLKSGDVILEINGQPATQKYEAQIANLGAGAILLLVVRRGTNEIQLEWKLGTRQQMIYQLIDRADINSEQRARRAAWLFDKPMVSHQK
jgi:predicted metalloprotease with PDZ domain